MFRSPWDSWADPIREATDEKPIRERVIHLLTSSESGKLLEDRIVILSVLESLGLCEEGAVGRFLAVCSQRGFTIDQGSVEEKLAKTCKGSTPRPVDDVEFFESFLVWLEVEDGGGGVGGWVERWRGR